MLQLVQFQKTGKLSIEDVPSPVLKPGGVLVHNAFSLISAGTERSSVKTAQASVVGKIRSRPDLVKQVLQNVQTQGLTATYRKVQNRLDNFKELGYSSAGIVVASMADDVRVGDRVACAGFAYHAELVSVPRHLVCRIPEGVELEDAAFTTLGAIALQGVRQAEVHIGETVVVIGLGLVGLITVQLLKANGCRVIGLDVMRSNFSLARSLGCDDCLLSDRRAVSKVEALTRGYGSDAVIITAATNSNEPVELSLQFARKKGTVVFVGSVGLDIPRAPFYEKELTLKYSCSYGPGRYDPRYEQDGQDYPIGYVRWTENRNMEGVLDLIKANKLNVHKLITHTYPLKDGLQAYKLVTGKVKQRYVGILIQYPGAVEPGTNYIRVHPDTRPHIIADGHTPVVGFIGAGHFAQSYLLPPIQHTGATLKGVATSTPINAKSVAGKFGFEYCSADPAELLHDPEINTVFVATRHDSHSRYTIEGLKNGKNVFVEKPLATNVRQLNEIRKAYADASKVKPLHLMVGFNRRFSAPFKDIKEFFVERKEPLVILYRVNAGPLPSSSWYQGAAQGGRLVGEGCHFIDCMTYLSGARPIHVYAEALAPRDIAVKYSDNVIVSLKFGDGSIGTLLYVANGDSSVPKEYCEVSSGGETAIMNDFTEVVFFKNRKKLKKKYNGLKGHKEEVEHFMKVVAGKEHPLLSPESIFDTTAATFAAMESLREGDPGSAGRESAIILPHRRD
jgi:polar amino acid transport system substrate-binding protein